ncbi:MAG: right-handed parallel beta-helix repeat-containing protein [Spirochaetales bacterium]|nr:right-handed parallel beta-helix repeat-containing protein [Spirochaetales bacterium]
MKKTSLILILLTVLMHLSASGDPEGILYVDSRSDGSRNGSSWETAYSSLTEALEAAEAGEEIWVAAGTYYPSETDQSVSFQMKDGVDLYGGFSGDESSRDERDWEKNVTVLSGEIGMPRRQDDNIKTVVKAANAVLDGFTITGGYGSGSGGQAAGAGQGNRPMAGGQSAGAGQAGNRPMGAPPQGAPGNAPAGQSGANRASGTAGQSGSSVGHMTPQAVLSQEGTPGLGAGIQIWQVSPTIRNCIITGNESGKAGGVYIVGNGVGPTKVSGEAVMPYFINCTISDNVASGRGGGVAIDMGGSALFVDTVFDGNSCTNGKGGAIYDDFGCSPYLINCLFTNNFAQSGAGMGNDGSSNPVIYNSTFYGNEASAAGAALYQGTGPNNDPTLVNSIIWGNVCAEDEASIYNWNDCYTSVSYSLVEGGAVGTAVLTGEPDFNDPKAGDFNYPAASILATAGIEGDRIGYDAEAAAGRTTKEVEALYAYVQELAAGYEPVILDRENRAKADSSLAGSSVLFVLSGADGSGKSWQDASGSLQETMDQAGLIYEATGEAVQVWIGEGTYLSGAERADSFILRDGVELYGGFSGSEVSLDQRNLSTNQTVLSGNIGNPDSAEDNSYHVLIGADEAVLNGLYITGGYADGAGGEVYDNKGGAVLNYWGGYRVRPDLEPTLGFDMTFEECVFYENYAQEGGAVYTYHGGNPVFLSCQFNDNEANYGGATVDRGGVNSLYEDCSFEGNSVRYKGGALFVDYGSMATVKDSRFVDNEAGTSGGAVYVIDRASQSIPNETDIQLIDADWSSTTDIFSSVLVEDSVFEENRAGVDGGALYIYESSNLKLTGTGFSGNRADRNGENVALINKSTLYGKSGLAGIYMDETSTY